MRDLKHLIYFENLLQTANNELIEKAKKKGGIAVAYTCENVPEPLLNLGKCFSIRLFAPQTVLLDPSARAADRLDGHRRVLHDEPALRAQPRPARARH